LIDTQWSNDIYHNSSNFSLCTYELWFK
jgi:hypothetical protein